MILTEYAEYSTMSLRDDHNSKSQTEGGYQSRHMKTVALSLLVIGVSLAAIILCYIWFGHIGPTFSSTVLEHQQASSRKLFGLPPEPPVPKQLLEVPPSLRNLTSSGSNTSSSSIT